MKVLNALKIIQDISSQQWGLITSAQATAKGIDRMALSRLEKNGYLERLRKGVYRVSAAPSTKFEDIYAAWLSFEPSQLSYMRSKAPDTDVIVSGVTASYVWGIGELIPEPITFTAPTRKQLRDKNIKATKRQLQKHETTIVHGLPITTLERTIADLVADGVDLSLVANVVRDAQRIKELDSNELIEYLKPYAKRAGLQQNDGTALFNFLIYSGENYVR